MKNETIELDKSKDCFYQEGKEDYFDGVDKHDCPYPEGSDGQFGWLKGWNAQYTKEKINDKRTN